MFALALGVFIGIVILVISTDQFVAGASRIASGLNVSSVLIGAVILGCGTGLPELALAFHGSRESPWHQLLGIETRTHSVVILGTVLCLVVILCVPIFFPQHLRRHSPAILLATVMFATLLRGGLNSYEGLAMICGFIIGVIWIIRNESNKVHHDPFDPVIKDEYQTRTGYIEAPVMSRAQIGFMQSVGGLIGTAVGSQMLSRFVEAILKRLHYSANVYGLVFVFLGSVLPHVVVAIQALKQHHQGLAVGNLIGSNLFHSIAIGGLVAVIRPYVSGGSIGWPTLGIVVVVASLTWLLLHTEDELSAKQGLALLASYIGLAVLVLG